MQGLTANGFAACVIWPFKADNRTDQIDRQTLVSTRRSNGILQNGVASERRKCQQCKAVPVQGDGKEPFEGVVLIRHPSTAEADKNRLRMGRGQNRPRMGRSH